MLQQWRWMCAAVAWVPTAALCQGMSLQPLSTHDARVLSDGRAEVALSVAYQRNERFPFFTAPGTLRFQNRWHLPRLGFRAGAADWVEIEAEYETIYLEEETVRGEANWQYGSGDARLHTKVRVRDDMDPWPAIAVRFGSKLPNANRDDRLGTDETDFDILALVSKDVGWWRLHANLGILLLGNPGQMLGQRFGPGGQDDLFVYALAVEGPPWELVRADAVQLRLLAEVSGLSGSRFGNDRARFSSGIRLLHGVTAMFLGASVGLDRASEDFGLRFGMTYEWDLSAWVEKIQ